MKQIILIGVDGASPNLLNNWMLNGKLCNFHLLKQKGVSGKLQSTIPPFSAPSWTSIVTGCTPGHHGIYDFFQTNILEKKLINSRFRRQPAIWNLLTGLDKKSIIVNVPVTFPPEKINGIIISGLLTPSNKSNYTYPINIKDDLNEKKLGMYHLDSFILDGIPLQIISRNNPRKIVDNVIRTMESQANVTNNLMKRYRWDFTMIVFRGTDEIQHYLWNEKKLIYSCYKFIDDFIGKTMQSYPDANIIVVSDHGFERCNKILYVNNILFKLNYLKLKSSNKTIFNKIIPHLYQRCNKVIYYMLPLIKLLPSSLFWKFLIMNDISTNIDFLKTKVIFHSISSQGLIITLRDKFDKGIVKREEYEVLRTELIGFFSKIKDSNTKKSIVKNVFRYEEIYGFDAVNEPPDLILNLHTGYGLQDLIKKNHDKEKTNLTEYNDNSYLFPPDFYDLNGIHSQYGIFYLYGKDFKQDLELSANVEDILPTILYSFGFSPPEWIDGHIIQDAFTNELTMKSVNWNILKKRISLSPAEIEKIYSLQEELKTHKLN